MTEMNLEKSRFCGQFTKKVKNKKNERYKRFKTYLSKRISQSLFSAWCDPWKF